LHVDGADPPIIMIVENNNHDNACQPDKSGKYGNIQGI